MDLFYSCPSGILPKDPNPNFSWKLHRENSCCTEPWRKGCISNKKWLKHRRWSDGSENAFWMFIPFLAVEFFASVFPSACILSSWNFPRVSPFSIFVCMCSVLSRVWLFATPCAVACQAPLSMEFFGQEYWSELSFSSSRRSSQPRDRTCVSCISYIGRQILYH